jgi:apolipoprotein N-acyltransferase
MDYVNPAAQYGQNRTKILLVPAWDFDLDAEVHIQGALVRGIENGYTLVRNARNGFMTVTTETGELLGKNSSIGIIPEPAVLLINTPVSTKISFYSQHHYWFVWLLASLLGCLLIQAVLIRSGSRINDDSH